MRFTMIRWILPGFLIIVFLALMLSSFNVNSKAWTEFNRSLETTLLIEARARAGWLSDRLDPFFTAWRSDTRQALLPDWTGASWLLLDASGETALDDTGEALYAEPLSASEEVVWQEDLAEFNQALQGYAVCGPAWHKGGKYGMRVFVPVSTASGSISTHWVLVGEANQGTGEDTAFSQMFETQRRFWLTTIPLAAASLLFLVLLIRGISRTQRLERSLREAEESMELESLTSTLAHEVRNPLSIIQSCAEILRKQEPLSEDGKELVQDMIEEVHRTQDVLSRHLHPERYLVHEIDDVVAFCRDFWKRREALLETRQITLTESYPPEEGLFRAQGIPEHFGKILDNLLRNSIEALPGGGQIAFCVSVDAGQVLITFQDNGPGLQGKPLASSEKPGGKGLGLRLAHKWLKKWGGNLVVQNRHEGFFRRCAGTEIRISLRRLSS